MNFKFTVFTIEVSEIALVVRGEFPARALGAIGDLAETLGFDRFAMGACGPLGASLVMTSASGFELLQKAIARKARERAGGDALEEWLRGADTGISSLAIAEILGGRRCGPEGWVRSPPQDPDDLGRCVRLLDLMPGWRERLREVAEAEPSWAALVEAWDELEGLYREEEASKRAPRCYERMRELLDGGSTWASRGTSGTPKSRTKLGASFESIDGGWQ